MKEVTAYQSIKGVIYSRKSDAIKEDLSEETTLFCQQLQKQMGSDTPWMNGAIWQVFLKDTPELNISDFAKNIKRWRKIKKAADAQRLAEDTAEAVQTEEGEPPEKNMMCEEDLPF